MRAIKILAIIIPCAGPHTQQGQNSMKAFTLIPVFAIAAACGDLGTQGQVQTRSETTPITQANAATEAAAKAQPGTQGLQSWPTSGAIDCNIVIGTRFTATYHVSAGATQRSAHVQFHDSFTGGDYAADTSFGMAEMNSADSYVKRNADYASMGVYEADFGAGHTRWWGFALDISTLTVYANNAVLAQKPAIESGPLEAVASTDCRYTP